MHTLLTINGSASHSSDSLSQSALWSPCFLLLSLPKPSVTLDRLTTAHVLGAVVGQTYSFHGDGQYGIIDCLQEEQCALFGD